MSTIAATLHQKTITWTRVDTGFYVGSHNTGFAGYIHLTPTGTAHATTGNGHDAGVFPSLHEAKQHLAAIPTDEH